MIRSMSPKLLFVVEQEADHNLNRSVDRFVEGLNYYSAVFDSIESTLAGDERIILEEMFGREIENIVACEGLERIERHERYAIEVGS
ncbi:SCARECROW-LIKE PROTEIN 3 [Salix purpurea]|uniref:SCARECROW-LIKE PROTEIN 3 n=1 Tax=Salix purpurea TaxID=77065 RepID=A0A9Q1AC01_SALPP|nr:SCARECROW-LIKE PROTEIN 3 [Salix purpurea]